MDGRKKDDQSEGRGTTEPFRRPASFFTPARCDGSMPTRDANPARTYGDRGLAADRRRRDGGTFLAVHVCESGRPTL